MKKSLSLLSCNTTQTQTHTKEYWHGLRHYGYRGRLFRVLPILMFFMIGCSTFAQNGIFVDSTSNVLSTITRSRTTGNNLVHYAKTSDSTGKFIFGFYHDSLPPFLYHFKEIPISGYDITDFTVLHDTVHMCGNRVNGRGFYAWMKLGPSPSTVQLNVTNLCDDTSYVMNPCRIHVFYMLSHRTIALIGDYLGPSTVSLTPAVIRIGFNGCGAAFGDREYFDDIAVLDNYIVTIARKGYNNPTSASQYMRVVYKSGFNLLSPLFKTCYEISSHNANERILLQHVGGDNLVSVYQNGPGYYLNSLSVSGSGVLQLQKSFVVDSVVDHIHDISYNSTDTSIMIIHSKTSLSTATRLSSFSFPYISWIESSTPNVSGFCSGCQALIMSMARRISTKFMVSGILNNNFMVWNTNNGCNISQRIGVGSHSERMSSRNNPTTYRKVGTNSFSIQCPIQILNVEQICY